VLIAQVTDIHLGFEKDNPDEFNRKRLDQVLRHLLQATGSWQMLSASVVSPFICVLATMISEAILARNFLNFLSQMVSCNMRWKFAVCGY